MENYENLSQSASPVTINNEIKDYLVETSKWGKFLAITGYIGMGFIVLLGLVFMLGSSAFNSLANTGFPIGVFGLVYILMAVLYYFPVTYLYRFSSNIRKGLNTGDPESVSSGFKNLKSLYKFMGIFTIVILSIYVLAIVIAIPVAIFAAAA